MGTLPLPDEAHVKLTQDKLRTQRQENKKQQQKTRRMARDKKMKLLKELYNKRQKGRRAIIQINMKKDVHKRANRQMQIRRRMILTGGSWPVGNKFQRPIDPDQDGPTDGTPELIVPDQKGLLDESPQPIDQTQDSPTTTTIATATTPAPTTTTTTSTVITTTTTFTTTIVAPKRSLNSVTSPGSLATRNWRKSDCKNLAPTASSSVHNSAHARKTGGESDQRGQNICIHITNGARFLLLRLWLCVFSLLYLSHSYPHHDESEQQVPMSIANVGSTTATCTTANRIPGSTTPNTNPATIDNQPNLYNPQSDPELNASKSLKNAILKRIVQILRFHSTVPRCSSRQSIIAGGFVTSVLNILSF